MTAPDHRRRRQETSCIDGGIHSDPGQALGVPSRWMGDVRTSSSTNCAPATATAATDFQAENLRVQVAPNRLRFPAVQMC